MKADIHPQDYRLVVFQDLSNNASFLIKSTAKTKETVKHKDGRTYPLVKLHITSASHPFYTGSEKVIDIEGRIDKFKHRKQASEKARAQLAAKSLKRSGGGQKDKKVLDQIKDEESDQTKTAEKKV